MLCHADLEVAYGFRDVNSRINRAWDEGVLDDDGFKVLLLLLLLLLLLEEGLAVVGVV